MIRIDEIELHYEEDARSVHTVLRVIDPDNPDNRDEVLFDNLATPVGLISYFGWQIRQELIGFANTPTAEQLGGGMTDLDHANLRDGVIADEAAARVGASALAGWREHVSGPGNDALIIEVYGKPSDLAEANR